MTEKEDKALRVYRKLLGFYNSETAIHFKIDGGEDAGRWRNGHILLLDITSLSMVLKEFVLGERPYLLEEVNEDSIVAYTTKGEEDRNEKV